jgi:hypothetical protein
MYTGDFHSDNLEYFLRQEDEFVSTCYDNNKDIHDEQAVGENNELCETGYYQDTYLIDHSKNVSEGLDCQSFRQSADQNLPNTQQFSATYQPQSQYSSQETLSGLAKYSPQVSNPFVSTTKVRRGSNPEIEKRRTHRCDFPNCNKVYTKSSHLKAHMRIHTGKGMVVNSVMYFGRGKMGDPTKGSTLIWVEDGVIYDRKQKFILLFKK